jgi:transposase
LTVLRQAQDKLFYAFGFLSQGDGDCVKSQGIKVAINFRESIKKKDKVKKMEYITGIDRQQSTLFPEVIDDYISYENPVRFIEAFVEGLDLTAMGFNHSEIKQTGRPPYNPKDPLKLHIYGYLNRIRSSRNMEKETIRNIEVIWLLKRLSPDHKTISDFRRNNTESIGKVFKEFIQLCKKLELFSAELIAVDSTKFRASNARDRIKDRKQLEKSIVHIEDSITEYLKLLEENDQKDESKNQPSITKEELQKKISFLKRAKGKLQEAKVQMEDNGDKSISLTDKDCRLVKNQVKIEPGYNVHTAVDSKHSMIVDYEVSQNAADNDYLSIMAIAAKETLEVEKINACADAGYFDSIDIKKCEDNKVRPYVPIPAQKVSKKINVPQPKYYHDKFKYDEQTDSYCCPEGNRLQFYYKTKKRGKTFRIYRTTACRECPVKNLCTSSPRGRYIDRWEHEHLIENLRERLLVEPQIIKRRKSIVEHPFGTMKKLWGYSTLLLKGIEKVSTEIALMTLAYNIRRSFTIIGISELIKAL